MAELARKPVKHDHAEFLARARNVLGHPIDVVSGQEEARLADAARGGA